MIIGYTTGVFDMFHIGHLHIIRRAKDECDRLVVGVTTDELSIERKGKRPIIPFVERSEIVGAIRYVDEVVPQGTMDKMAAWEAIRFNRMFVGDDWKNSPTWDDLQSKFAQLGVDVRYFPYTPHISSTKLKAFVLEMEAAG